MEDHLVIAGVLIVLGIFSIIFVWKTKSRKLQRPPPPEIAGGWPVIGHLLQFIGADEIPLSRKLEALADKYGPVFTFRQGLPRVLVVSSWDAVKDCLTTNDKVFSARPASLSGEYIGYNNAMLFLASYGPYWRKIRKIVLQEVLSSSRLEKLKHVRISEVQMSIKEIYSLFHSADTVKLNLSNWLEKLALNVIVKMIAGKSYGRHEREEEDREEAERLKKALKDFMYISMEFVLWDAFPIPLFKWIGFQGHLKLMKTTFNNIDYVLQGWLDEHLKKDERIDNVVAGKEQDFIDVMLSTMSQDDFADTNYTRETTIKATALSMVLDASDTTAIHLNWVMATLLNHKDVMKKAQEEIDIKVGREKWVEESDIKNLVYLQAVVKETLRLYPPAPLLVPHESVEDCIVSGYHIPKGTRLMINVQKLQRDPEIWSDPDKFEPERFLTSSGGGIDVRGQHYELIPFGSGRRSCPGIIYATQLTHLAIARLIQGFDIRTPLNLPLDMKEGLGMTLRKANPIHALVTPRLPPLLYV